MNYPWPNNIDPSEPSWDDDQEDLEMWKKDRRREGLEPLMFRIVELEQILKNSQTCVKCGKKIPNPDVWEHLLAHQKND